MIKWIKIKPTKKKNNTKMPLEFVSSFLTRYYKGVYICKSFLQSHIALIKTTNILHKMYWFWQNFLQKWRKRVIKPSQVSPAKKQWKKSPSFNLYGT